MVLWSGVTFRVTSDAAVSESLGMPDIPKVKLPHPVAGTGTQNIKQVAKEIAPQVIQALEAAG